jgi:hypothetical protein
MGADRAHLLRSLSRCGMKVHVLSILDRTRGATWLLVRHGDRLYELLAPPDVPALVGGTIVVTRATRVWPLEAP